jgi:ABC-2 type transport system ATP-binding protein
MVEKLNRNYSKERVWHLTGYGWDRHVGDPVIVEIEGLRKIYEGKQRVVAVDGIDLAVREGELYGLLGPNGAGKTTTISICTTRALPTAGQVRIAGVDVVALPAIARRGIGVVPQYNTLDRACTIFENLYFHCLFFGFSRVEAKSRTEQLLAQFHLTERSGAYPAQLSGGLAQRVQIARAIAHRPKVLFLDEPSAGLDPQSRIAMWGAVRELRHEGITVVLTTHYMEEADELCDRVAIIDHGKILVEDTPAALKASIGAEKIYVLNLRQLSVIPALLDKIGSMPGVTSAEAVDSGVRIFAQGADGLLSEIVQAATPYGLHDLSVTGTSLETVFIKLTGRDLRE